MYNPSIVLEPGVFASDPRWIAAVDQLNLYIDGINSGLIDPPYRPQEIILTARDFGFFDWQEFGAGYTSYPTFGSGQIDITNGNEYGSVTITIDPTSPYLGWGNFSNVRNLMTHELAHAFHLVGPHTSGFHQTVVDESTALGVVANINDRLSAAGNECFVADTKIRMFDGSTKPIQSISIGDIVLSKDSSGADVPGEVVKTFNNKTSRIVRIDPEGNSDPIFTTPGHRFLTEFGYYLEIEKMMTLCAGRVRLVSEAGDIVVCRAKELSKKEIDIQFNKCISLREAAGQGSRGVLNDSLVETFNFEVAQHHNYIANSICVHNDSILSSLGDNEIPLATNSDLTEMAVIRDVNEDEEFEIVIVGGTNLFGLIDTQEIASFRYVSSSPIDSVVEDFWLLAEFNEVIHENVIDPSSGNEFGDGAPPDDIVEFLDERGGYFELLTASDDVEFHFGNDGNDVIDQSSADSLVNWIFGGSGNDTLTGGTSEDVIVGSEGSDILWGGEQSDFLLSAATELVGHSDSSDSLYGGNGSDVLVADDNGDFLSGGADSDALFGGMQSDGLFGGSGQDYIQTNGGQDSIYGGLGDDWINALDGESEAIIFFEANSGNDFIQQSEGDSGEVGVAQIRFVGLTSDDVRIQYTYTLQQTNFSDDGELSIMTFSVEGQATVFTLTGDDPNTSAPPSSINIGTLSGELVVWNYQQEQLEGTGVVWDLAMQNSHELVFDDGSVLGDNLINHSVWSIEDFDGTGIPEYDSGFFSSEQFMAINVTENGHPPPPQNPLQTFQNPFFNDWTPTSSGDVSVFEQLTPATSDTINGAHNSLQIVSDGIVYGTEFADVIDSAFRDLDGDVISDAGQIINALDGNDQIFDGAGNDSVFGGGGNDRFMAGGGSNLYDGGTGNADEVRYDADVGIVVDMLNSANSTGIAAGDQYVDIERVRTSQFDDIIILGDDIFLTDARGGNDDITDAMGREIMRGGAGADIFHLLSGDGERDVILDFTIGLDVIDISAWGVSDFADLSFTQDGAAAIVSYGTESLELTNLGAQIDSFTGSDFGLAGSSTQYGAVDGTSAADVIDFAYVDGEGDSLSDLGQDIYGGFGNDFIYSGAGADRVFGGDGNDRMFASLGADTYDGGNGNADEVRFDATVGIVLDMTNAANSTDIAAGDTFINIERVRTGQLNDVIVLANDIFLTDARGGDDDITDAMGREIMRGGSGADTFRFLAGDGEQDRILDFVIGTDTIDITSWGVGSFGDLSFTASGTAAIVAFGSERIELDGLAGNLSDFTASDFDL